ncbi:enoyl-CoA hydratase [Neobacillus niacini]|uniref:enoyl-CoA hydratase/isomerase family protein n=1 Tax=Neobacillus niacini TaxID=86668 RepID=UPI0028646D39|nr:enoyl-CoA hydratase-related protein [Neobacillus niacini]MDR7076147.1 enoyl-CoA hydratase [Neobacillus niacini]
MSLIVEKKNHILYVTINRPEAMNSITPELKDELHATFDEFEADDTLRVAILTGAGEKAFCAGADLKKLVPKMSSGERPIAVSDQRWFSNVYKPIITAVNGWCLAGGVEMMNGTDIRIASEHARFGLSEAKWALYPAGGSVVRLVRHLPWARAMEIILTGNQFTAEEAYHMGLINKVVPKEKLIETAEEYAEKIANNGPLAVRAIKEMAVRSLDLPMSQAFYWDSYMSTKIFKTEDAKEGPKAFAEKRKPNFIGK